MFQDYKDWLDEHVGFIIDPMDDLVNALIPYTLTAIFALYVVFGWAFIVAVLTPLAAIISLCKRCIR